MAKRARLEDGLKASAHLLTLGEVAERMGASPRVAHRRLVDAGIRPAPTQGPSKAPSPEAISKAMDEAAAEYGLRSMLAQGLTLAETALRLGIRPEAVHRRIHRIGLRPPKA